MAMDDHSVLSAYLDGVLDEFQRKQVEAAILADQKLRQELEGLTELRNCLGQLSRPGVPLDLSDLVAGQAGDWLKQRRPAARAPLSLRPWLVLGPLSAAAAALLIFWLAVTYDRTPGEPGPPLAVKSTVRAPGPDQNLTQSSEILESGPIPLTPLLPGVAGISPLFHDLDPLQEAQVHDLTDLPAGGTLKITARPLTVDLMERLDGAIQHAPRVSRHHAVFTAFPKATSAEQAQHPQIVYAVSFDQVEYERFREILKTALEGTGAKLSEQLGDASRPAGLAQAKVRMGEVEPSGSIVPFAATELLGDRTSGGNSAAAIAPHYPETLGLILQDMMASPASNDHQLNRQLLREILGMGAGKFHDGRTGSAGVYFIEVVEP